MKCQKCGTKFSKLKKGKYFERVNEKGVKGIWECRPSCIEHFDTQEAAILSTIKGKKKDA